MNALILLFYKIAAFFTRVPKKSREKDIKIRSSINVDPSISSGAFINRQSNLSNLPYGSGNMGYNGCGPIAVYNALLALGKEESSHKSDISLISVIDCLEKKGATLRGKFGTSPASIRKFLKSKGYSTGVCISKNSDKILKFANDYDIFISVVYNNKNTIKDGLHIICSEKRKKCDSNFSFTTHNPEHTSDNLYDALNMCSNNEIRHVYTVGIIKPI